MTTETVPVKEAAKRLDIDVATLQAALIDRQLPVGFAIKCRGGRHRYIIPRAAFERMMDGTLTEGTEAVI